MGIRVYVGLLGVLALIPSMSSSQNEYFPERRPSFTSAQVLPSNGDRKTTLAPGSFVSIYGRNLGGVTMCQGKPDLTRRETVTPDLPGGYFGDNPIYPTELCGVQVFVGDIAAGVLYVQERQINFKVPRQTPPGTSEVRVAFDGRSSDAVPIRVGPPFIQISLAEPAYVGMPIWIELHSPGPPVFRYPVGLNPSDFGCTVVEVRHRGTLLQRIPNTTLMREGIVGAGLPCSLLALPRQPEKQGRVPLHLLYSFEEPGSYEVKFTSLTPAIGSSPAKIIMDSAWTPIEVHPPAKNQRAQWLAQIKMNLPSDSVDLLSDFLPSVLGIPDDASLSIVQQYLHYPDQLVRRYAMRGLFYWSKAEVEKTLRNAFEEKGPSDVIAGFFTGNPDISQDELDRLVRDSLAYLRSESPVLLRGAIMIIRGLALPEGSRVSAPLRARAKAAMMEATEHIVQTADPPTLNDFTAMLGTAKEVRAHEILWDLVRRQIALSQALTAITWRRDPADLPKVGQFLQARTDDAYGRNLVGLPYALYQAYGADAVPYLEGALRASGYVFVKTSCARELIIAGRPTGFAFVADAIEENRPYKMEMVNFVKGKFSELRAADEAAVLAFLKRHSQ